jgi:uncharacterized protein (TIGR02145 family)
MVNKAIYKISIVQKNMKKTGILLIGILISAMILSSCGESGKTERSTETEVERIAGKGEIKLGDQIWMDKNLDVAKFRNGDSIPEAKTSEEWLKAYEQSKPAWCYYDNDPKNGLKYGKLYNWFAITDTRMLAPEGWLIPSQLDWQSLARFCDTAYDTHVDVENLENTRFGTIELIDRKDWDTLTKGVNKSGFTGLPAGLRDSTGTFHYFGNYTGWWSTTEVTSRNFNNPNNSNEAYVFLFSWAGQDYHNAASRASGFSVRCVR